MSVRVQTKTIVAAGEEIIGLDHYGSGSEISIQVSVSGSVSYTVSSTLDDIQDETLDPAAAWFDHPDLTAKTVSLQANYAYKPRFIRIVNSGSGKVRLTIVQSDSL